ncbi:unnamed protein product [Adineta steineri]|uniref:LITAF domain-containing protein n=1 Tax=Adineta steineri TaxID=433720 RepID=A0A814W821_9BILA|nr:unnamed protein product [Adineta steineri]CAF1198568.1 unnamed protein product [Adineta steineri]
MSRPYPIEPNASNFDYDPGQASNPQEVTPLGTSNYIQTQIEIYGDELIQCTCPYCKRLIITRVERKTGFTVWLVCGTIILLGGCFGCCLIPFCIKSLKDKTHYCSSCGARLCESKLL